MFVCSLSSLLLGCLTSAPLSFLLCVLLVSVQPSPPHSQLPLLFLTPVHLPVFLTLERRCIHGNKAKVGAGGEEETESLLACCYLQVEEVLKWK